jgi:hypothetical protein
VIACRATLDVPRAFPQYLAQLLLVERAARGTRRGRRTLGVFSHSALVLRSYRESAHVARLARNTGIGISTCYPHFHEDINGLAAQAPGLPEVLTQRLARGRLSRAPGWDAHTDRSNRRDHHQHRGQDHQAVVFR